jgi:hypothetical protein
MDELNRCGLFWKVIEQAAINCRCTNSCLSFKITAYWERRCAMLMKHISSGDLVEVLDLLQLHDPSSKVVCGRFQAGEEVQEPEEFRKTDLVFPSGESLPLCWRDSAYRQHGK